MEYKIFGAGGEVPDGFQEDLAAFCRLAEDQRNAIAEWFLSARSYEIDQPNLPPIIVASSLLPEQFRQAAGVIGSVLFGWQGRRLELADIERDLLLLGFDSEQITVLLTFLDRLSSIKKRVWIDGRKGFEQSTGLPTVDDVNIVWNARPVFGGDAYYYYDGDSNQESYNRLLDVVYLATFEINASDRSGEQSIAIQMTEETFERLLLSMKRAGEQLETFKRCARTTIPDAGEAQGAE